ncbi:hypothetical protein E1289_22005 [Actinomadura sp. 6K520]|nr:hypothetical protein E1289_22005 [Actinomadura sp. 6K520]
MPGSTERPRGTTLLDPAGTARSASFSLGCRVYLARGPCPGPFFRRLRGDLTAGLAPGLAPSPGRSWLRAAAGVPISACLLPAPTVTHAGAGPLPVSRAALARCGGRCRSFAISCGVLGFPGDRCRGISGR